MACRLTQAEEGYSLLYLRLSTTGPLVPWRASPEGKGAAHATGGPRQPSGGSGSRRLLRRRKCHGVPWPRCRLRRAAEVPSSQLHGVPWKRSDRFGNARSLFGLAGLRPLALKSHGGDLAGASYMSHGRTTAGIPRRVVPSRTCCLKMGHIVRWICLSVNTFRRPWSDQSWSNAASSLTVKARMKTEV